jgi:hypothetical protein
MTNKCSNCGCTRQTPCKCMKPTPNSKIQKRKGNKK